MTMQHGTQPKTKPNKASSDDQLERKRGVKPTLPPRDGTTRTKGVSEKHRAQDSAQPKHQPKKDVDENLREY